MPGVPDSKDQKPRSDMSQLLDLAALGFMFPVAIGTGFLIGRWLDGQFDTWPWLTAIFSLFGIAAAFVNLFRSSSKAGSSGPPDGAA